MMCYFAIDPEVRAFVTKLCITQLLHNTHQLLFRPTPLIIEKVILTIMGNLDFKISDNCKNKQFLLLTLQPYF